MKKKTICLLAMASALTMQAQTITGKYEIPKVPD